MRGLLNLLPFLDLTRRYFMASAKQKEKVALDAISKSKTPREFRGAVVLLPDYEAVRY